MGDKMVNKEQRRDQLAMTIAFGFFGALLLIGAVFSLGGALFSDVIPDPPWLELNANSIDQDVTGPLASDGPDTVFAAQSPRLAAPGPRIVWATAVSLTQLGQAMLMFLAVRVLFALRTASFFSDAVNKVVRFWWLPALAIGAGSVTRQLTDGWVASAYGHPLADTDLTRFSLQSIPGVAVITLFAAGYIWAQGRALQKFNDEAI